MKKIKRIVLSALSVVMLFCMMAMPASAMKDVSLSASDQGSESDFYWETALNVSGNSGSARVTVTVDTHGALPAVLDASLEGHVYATGNQSLSLSGSRSTYGQKTVTATDTRTISGAEMIGAYCDFNPNGATAKRLIVGEIPSQVQ